jgi:hypothetical protein
MSSGIQLMYDDILRNASLNNPLMGYVKCILYIYLAKVMNKSGLTSTLKDAAN